MAPLEVINGGAVGNGGAMDGHTNGAYTNGHTNGANGAANGVSNGTHDATVPDEEEEEHEMFPEDMNLRVMGIGVEYPPHKVVPKDLETIAQKHYPQTESIKKVLSINRFTGIEARRSVGECMHPIANQEAAPKIDQLHELFMEHGVSLATSACSKAIQDAGYTPSAITHTVFTTCTDSANPGYDIFVLKNLGVKNTVEKVLLHGVGCSGGLAGLRTACNIALGAKARGRRARVLVCATEICTVLVRSELDSILAENNIRIGITLFSDCSGAAVVSNGVGEDWSKSGKGVYGILGWKHDTVEKTEKDIGFDIDPLGWKVILTPRVPKLTSEVTPTIYKSLFSSISPSVLSSLSPSNSSLKPEDLDWALHPGGSLILTGVSEKMNISVSNLRSSFEVYTNFGNSSSATIFSVMDRLRSDTEAGIAGEGPTYGPGFGIKGGRKGVLGCAFGPGVSIEMMLMKRVEPNGDKLDGVLENGVVEITNGVHEVQVGGEELD
ncbi:hypothetical protein H072_2363 [Dactylellina haptotyla CBS 200.50]|uniref:Chalcone/stilbene synthase N-terminal domain-containing protein n=1 Tax=Dactylellina haptotyla (strain CBS 200.50) TaxID=1284197 RepID=S8BVV0_DACHA|nr:hypothetical protein H072_2363 [Dactylellina haptotyla CBS 200.50]